jgi:DinB superfamily
MQSGHPDDNELAPHAKPYVTLVPEGNITDLLAAQGKRTLKLLEPVSDDYAAIFAYAPGKWTIKQILGHLIDTERIFATRALRLARNDATPLPGFDQDDYVASAGSNSRKLSDLLNEFRLVRESTLALYQSFPLEAWTRRGLVNNWHLSVRGIAFTTAGHELHHVKILQDRYLNSGAGSQPAAAS